MLSKHDYPHKVVDDAEQIIEDAQKHIEEQMSAIVSGFIKGKYKIKKMDLEIIYEALTEAMACEPNVNWARDVASDYGLDADIYPAPGLCDRLADEMDGSFRKNAGDDFVTTLLNGLKPPTREQMEAWRNPATNPATKRRVAVRSGDAVQFIEFGE